MKPSRVLERTKMPDHPPVVSAKVMASITILVVGTLCVAAWWQRNAMWQRNATPHRSEVHVAVAVTTPLSTPSAAPSATIATPEPGSFTQAKPLSYRVVGVHPHDANAFTQGLLWHNGGFYESTGLEGRSSLRRVAFPSGGVLAKRNVPAQYFAEGLALANDKLVQITWQNGKAFVYERATFKPLKTWNYSGEGWGLTFNGKHFVMSDGSATIAFRDAENFQIVRRILVTMNGEPLTQLNELEWIDGRIWANVWKTDFIVQIDAQSGRVVSYLDLSNLHQRTRTGGEDVLNGIAYDLKGKRLFVTGKLWPKLYEIKVASTQKLSG